MKNSTKKWLSPMLWAVLLAAVALIAAGCSGEGQTPGTEKSFTFVAVDLEGRETAFSLTSALETVGEALMEEGLIQGEAGDYGLYVLTVNGITLDWEKDQKYWAFYVDGEYALSGVDTTEIREGSTYLFRPE